jgi:hypothetical protein
LFGFVAHDVQFSVESVQDNWRVRGRQGWREGKGRFTGEERRKQR